MSTVSYNNTSPYFNTLQNSWALDLWQGIIIPAYDTDQILVLPQVYNNRPDLLSYDLYGTTRLWWTFAVRNSNVIKDPIFDFTTGITIYVTNKDTLLNILGI